MELALRVGEALGSSLELQVALDRAVPLLRQLVGADHVALAISRPGTLYDYAWHNTSLPQSFLGNYAKIADRDFVRNAVGRVPHRVLRDHEMITRKRLERHLVYQHARDSGARLEQVMAVMLSQDNQWSSGLSLYRERRVPFSENEASVLQMLVPHFENAVRNCRQHVALSRDPWLEPVAEHAGLSAVWVDAAGRELERTRRAGLLLEHFFAPHERRNGTLPTALSELLQRFVAAGLHAPSVRYQRTRGLRRLTVSVVALKARGAWALVLRDGGLDHALEARLSPRLRDIASALLQGLSNEEIARRDGRKLSTIKQQVSQIYRHLGVDGRNGLIQLVSGFAAGEAPSEAAE